MYLLRMASNQLPAADDLVPVLIYVIIKVRKDSTTETQQEVNFNNLFPG